MFDEADLTRLIAAMRQTGTRALEIDGAGDHLCLVLPEGAAPAAPPPARTLTAVKSPCLGLFAPCGMDDGLAAATPGAVIREGQVLGYVTTGAARVPVLAPLSGTLGETLPAGGQVTGWGDTLFTLEGAA